MAAAARLLQISWDRAWHLIDRAVAHGLAAKPLSLPAYVGVDEEAAGRGQDYISLVSDLDAGTVEFIADERRHLVELLGGELLEVALTTAVDTLREPENRTSAAAGDKSLAGTKYLWL